MKLFIAPHNDDEALFGSFTILRESLRVVLVYDSYIQFRRGEGITAERRRNESIRAMAELGAPVEFCGVSDESYDPADCESALRKYSAAEEVWVPAYEAFGNRHHNLIASSAPKIFKKCRFYLTYTSIGKSRGIPVEISLGWTTKKFRALACYESQLESPATRHHFLGDQYEYYPY